MIYIGTSGWHYNHWLGDFYPENVDNMLTYYGQQFKSTEVNNTFYGLPDLRTVETWRDSVPTDFRFSVKASQYITHMKKLKDPKESVKKLLDAVEPFDDQLSVILFQLPDNWHFNAERLSNFLELLPDHYRYAFEFRDKDWHNAETYDLLSSRNAAFCIYEYAGEVSPKEITADFAYVRLHGQENTPYEGKYDTKTLSGWAGAIHAWSQQVEDIYFYFDNDQYAYAAQNALQLQSMIFG